MRPAEEVAREMVSDYGWVSDGQSGVALLSDVAADGARELLARLIERSRAEGAAAELERLAVHAERPAEEVAKEMVRGPSDVSSLLLGGNPAL